MSASASPDRGTTDARSRPWFAAQSADTLPPSADTLAPVRSSCGNTARAHVVPEVISRLRLYAPVPVPLPQRPGLGGSLTKASRTSCRGCRNRPRSFNRTMRLYLPMRDVMRTTAQPMKATTSANEHGGNVGYRRQGSGSGDEQKLLPVRHQEALTAFLRFIGRMLVPKQKIKTAQDAG
jgi:hypothetical protein